jgi:hypothetical protein
MKASPMRSEKAVVVYLASYDRPMHELLDAKPKNVREFLKTNSLA